MQSLLPVKLIRKDGLFQYIDVALEQEKAVKVNILLQQSTEAIALIPLLVKGQVIGIIQMESRQSKPLLQLDTAQMSLAMNIANTAAVVLENARLYEEQLETLEKLRELDQLKSRFLANMSHELRTPLNAIIGFSRVMLKGIEGPLSEAQQQDLTAIHNAGTHLLELMNSILDISKIEAGKMELAFEDSVNIPDLVDSAISTAAGLATEKDIQWEKQFDEGLPEIRCDPTRIRQILINLLSNAVKFTDQGLITVKIRWIAQSKLGTEKKRSELMISVTDTGIGISQEDQAKIFHPFIQIDSTPNRTMGGSGLGLSISRLLVELHGGRIGVNSDSGKGSTFFFTLPVDSRI